MRAKMLRLNVYQLRELYSKNLDDGILELRAKRYKADYLSRKENQI